MMLSLLLLCLLHACFVIYATEEDPIQILEGNIKSCLGDHCSSFQRDDGVVRIGLLSPPRSGADVIWSILQHVKDAGGFKKSNKKQRKGSGDVSLGTETTTSKGHEPQLVLGDGIMLVLSSHVPPYGYGRNHGWSKIVRLYTDVADHTMAILPSTTVPALVSEEGIHSYNLSACHLTLTNPPVVWKSQYLFINILYFALCPCHI